MRTKVINKESLARIKDIHNLSLKYNSNPKKSHRQKLLQLVKEHAAEIEQLSREKNNHYLIETGDLIILCFELILDAGRSIDEILLKCFERYEKKLTQLLKRR